MIRTARRASPALLPAALSAVAAARFVNEGPDGLIYQPYANEGQANAVNTIPDFSRAGNLGGAVLLTKGEYTVSATLTPATAGVVLRGAGSSAGSRTHQRFLSARQSPFRLCEAGVDRCPNRKWVDDIGMDS